MVDLKTDPAVMACCDSANYNAASCTPLGLNDVLEVMTNKGIDTLIQRQDWTMEKNLSQDMKNY